MFQLQSASHTELLATCPVTPTRLTSLIKLVQQGIVSTTIGRQVLEKVLKQDTDPAIIVSQEGLAIVSDTGELERLIAEAIAANQKALADYLGGKEAAFNSFIGPVMKATKGKANPTIVKDLLRQALDRYRQSTHS